MNLRLSEANSLGTGPLAEAFDMLGLSARELQDMDPSQAFKRVAGELEGFDKADRGFLADAIFGGDSNYILKLLDRGADGIAELEAEAARLGATFSSDQVQGANEANAAMTRLWTVLEGTAGSIVSTMAPAITSFVNVGVAGAEWLAAKFVEWKDTMTTVFGTVEFLVTNMGSVWDVAVKSTAYQLSAIYEDTKHLFLTRMPETFMAFGGLALDTFTSITSKIGDIFNELWDYIASGGTDAIDINLSGLVQDLSADLAKASARLSAANGARDEAGYETLLREDMESAAAALGTGLQQHLAERLGDGVKDAAPELDREFRKLTMPDETTKGKTKSKDEDEAKSKSRNRDGAGAMQRGSVEAVSAIIAAQRGNANTAEAKQQQSLDEAVKFLRVIAKAGQPVIEGIRLS